MTVVAEAAPPVVHVREIDLHGLVLRIECPDAELRAGLDARFASFPGAPARQPDLTVLYDVTAPPHTRPDEARVVYASPVAEAVYAPSEDALYAFHGHGPTMRCSPALGTAEIRGNPDAGERFWVLTRPLLTLAIMELVRRRQVYPLHAACLAKGDAGVLVCGPSGSGKSTVTLALLEAGLDFLGDDLVFLSEADGVVRALGFPDEIGLTADARDVVSSLPAQVDLRSKPGWPKARGDVRQIAPDVNVRAACTPRLVIVLTETAAGDTFDRLDADSALLDLLPSILLTHPDACAGHLSALANLTTSATLIRSAARPDLPAVVELVVRTLSRLNDARKDAL